MVAVPRPALKPLAPKVQTEGPRSGIRPVGVGTTPAKPNKPTPPRPASALSKPALPPRASQSPAAPLPARASKPPAPPARPAPSVSNPPPAPPVCPAPVAEMPAVARAPEPTDIDLPPYFPPRPTMLSFAPDPDLVRRFQADVIERRKHLTRVVVGVLGVAWMLCQLACARSVLGMVLEEPAPVTIHR